MQPGLKPAHATLRG
uniref:Uncharacterized protein n=1 Tax=Arundo donax TaxID=35708 RepID=A0A0A9H775_ARUDO